MARFTTTLTEIRDERTLLIASRPLTFEEFVQLFGEDDDVELVDGMVVKRMAAKDPHEDLQGWLLSVVRVYVRVKGLGFVRGSRTAVKVIPYRGRLPDVLFVRKERADIVQEDGIFGVPDFVAEIISPGDKPAHLLAVETDYRSIGVPEIWFIDQKGKQVRVLRRRNDGYEERIVRRGVLRSEVMEGFWLRVEWLFRKPLPKEWEMLQQLLGKGR